MKHDNKQLSLLAPAKINWSLDVVGQREDGYHLLHMLMQSISLYDKVQLQVSTQDDCIVTNLPMEYGLDGAHNLAFKAWQILKRQVGLHSRLSIAIEKHIPLAGGLAGGSTDAAAVLLGANLLFDLGLSKQELCHLALQVGADVPFCLNGGLAMVEGIGELLTPLPAAPQYHLVVVNPGIAVPTAEVYRRFKMEEVHLHPDTCALQEALLHGDVQRIASCYGNVLESPAFAAYPQVACLKQCCLKFGFPTLMSGSGGSIWILVDDAQEARKVAAILRETYPFAAAVHSVAQGILVL